ncbi:IS200/IS605 family transposase [Endozoicomonas ascidiicola]|uniref:IS200/IS605 family transposase n=1 Tax=Endozoicomonas ascidiicola TaxID=1698521 RepID=UPI000830BEF8|nr:IS200/IS605 family transposase [Endozoicomonas ascidiicola]
MFTRFDYAPFNNCYHFTAATKYRKSVFEKDIRERAEEILTEKSKEIGATVLAVTAAVNHIHLLIQSDHSPSDIGQKIFGTTSRLLRKEFPELKNLHSKQLWGGKACTPIKDQAHLDNTQAYVDRHDPFDASVDY